VRVPVADTPGVGRGVSVPAGRAVLVQTGVMVGGESGVELNVGVRLLVPVGLTV